MKAFLNHLEHTINSVDISIFDEYLTNTPSDSFSHQIEPEIKRWWEVVYP